MKKILLFFLSVFLVSFAYANTGPCFGEYCFDCYDFSQGLPQNHVVAFVKTQSGHIFIAGRNSISRFDGKEFVVLDRNGLIGLPTNTINDFVSDNVNTGYLATDLGLWTMDLGSFKNFSFKNIDKLGNLSVKSLAYDSENRTLYGAIEEKGVFAIFANGSLEWFTPENSRLGTRKVEKVFVKSDGTVWVGTKDGVWFLKNGGEKFVQVDYLEDSISAFAEAGNTIYAGGLNGYYAIENGEVALSFAGKNASFRDITALTIDDLGRLWIGTKNSGLFLDKERAGKIDGAITAFVRDNEGEMWFGTSTEGFCIAKKGALQRVIFDNVSISGIVADASGNVFMTNATNCITWLGKGEESEFFHGEICDVPNFDHLFIDKFDTLWASGPTGLYIMQSDKSFKPVKEIFTSEEDLFPASSDVFFSDADGNVLVNDLSLPGAFFVFSNDRTAKRFMLPYPDAEIVDIIEYNGKISVITRLNGLFELDDTWALNELKLWKKDVFVKEVFVDSKQRIGIVTLSDEIFVHLENDTMFFNVIGAKGEAAIHSITEDRKGNYWLMTSDGVVKIKGGDADCFISGDCADVPIVLYGKKDGMSSVECAEGKSSNAALSTDGTLFVLMMKGIAVFDTNYTEESTYVPEIVIESIYADNDGTNYLPDEHGVVHLPHSAKTLEISYSAPLFSGSGGLLFSCYFDDEQIKRTTKNKVVFTNVSGGDHDFSIRAYRSGNYKKHTEKKIVFKVSSAFYEKKGFLLALPFLCVFFVAFLIFLSWHHKMMREKEIKQLVDEKTAELRMKNDALQEAVMKDPLTGLMNRRYLLDFVERKIRHFIESYDRKIHFMNNRNLAGNNNLIYSVIIMDIDHFKRVNDLYGHDAGDIVLKELAQVMRDSVRVDDVVIRWGGEEFLILLKNIPFKKILDVVKKVRKAIEMHPFHLQNGTTLWITVSMGVVPLPLFFNDPKLLTFEHIITLADLALYDSKHRGRDKATFVIPGDNVPKNSEERTAMLTSSEFAAVNGFYTFENIEPDNFSEFEI